MTMRRLTTSRRHRGDLLTRPPSGGREVERGWLAWIVDPVEQLRELADLRDRGLLSQEEYELHKAKVLER
jgi:Short C-terminal domain